MKREILRHTGGKLNLASGVLCVSINKMLEQGRGVAQAEAVRLALKLKIYGSETAFPGEDLHGRSAQSDSVVISK